jgi:hypothetical protein
LQLQKKSQLQPDLQLKKTTIATQLLPGKSLSCKPLKTEKNSPMQPNLQLGKISVANKLATEK